MSLEANCSAMCQYGRLFMSTKQIIRSGLMGSAAFAALGLTACANSHAQSNRYASGTHYDYESAQSCGSSCATGVVTTPTYRPAPKPTTHYGYEGVPCSTSCGVATTGYTTVTSGYPTTTTSHGYTTGYSQETAPCPAGTTSQPDGTCLMGGGHVSSSYTGSTSYSSGGYSSGYSTGYSSGAIAPCPAGTTTQPDGSCLQGGHASYSSHTSSTYSAPVTSTYSSTYSAPVGGAYVAPELVTECCAPVSSTHVYSGDATSEVYSNDTTTTDTYGGYATSGATYSSSDYLPIRK